jgi:hypothetical protein
MPSQVSEYKRVQLKRFSGPQATGFEPPDLHELPTRLITASSHCFRAS